MGASERDEFLRAAWKALVADGIVATRSALCSWTSAARTPRCARCTLGRGRGAGARGRRPAQLGQERHPALQHDAFGHGPVRGGGEATTRAVFEAYVEEALCPSLSPGQVVVMDNLPAHKGERVRELIEGRGCELVYLPPYSPDLNPIEQAFSKLKGLLRRAESRPRRPDRIYGSCAFGDHRPGRFRLLPPLRLPRHGSTAMTDALGAFVCCVCSEQVGRAEQVEGPHVPLDRGSDALHHPPVGIAHNRSEVVVEK